MPHIGHRTEVKHWLLRGLCLAAVLPSFISVASAMDCMGFQDLDVGTTVSYGTINGSVSRANFLKNGGDRKSCPSADPSCREKAYLVPGDGVVVSALTDEFACVDYVNPKGLVRSGWMPRAAITLSSDTETKDWAGVWKGNPEQNLTIRKSSKPDELTLEGEATFGALDPDRVERGAVNSGNLEAQTKPNGSSLAFTVGQDKTLAYDEGDGYDCKAQMRLVGPFLLVKDNNNCGGMNVSFTGIYRRAK